MLESLGFLAVLILGLLMFGITAASIALSLFGIYVEAMNQEDEWFIWVLLIFFVPFIEFLWFLYRYRG